MDIRKSIKINGNNHKLDFNNSQLIINSKQSIVFENIVFKNFNPNIFSKNISSINLTFLNCTSDYINPILLIFNPYDFGWSYATNESQYLKVFAEFIVGDSKSIDACKKIANWVGENIDHETKEGFYQSPKDTLLRKKGNCCSQTELFLQLCDSVGALEGHKVYFIHVGTKEFHQRHFFAMIDDVFVDVDTYSHSPWGHANFAGRSIYRITEYPYLPLPKQY